MSIGVLTLSDSSTCVLLRPCSLFLCKSPVAQLLNTCGGEAEQCLSQLFLFCCCCSLQFNFLPFITQAEFHICISVVQVVVSIYQQHAGTHLGVDSVSLQFVLFYPCNGTRRNHRAREVPEWAELPLHQIPSALLTLCLDFINVSIWTWAGLGWKWGNGNQHFWFSRLPTVELMFKGTLSK